MIGLENTGLREDLAPILFPKGSDFMTVNIVSIVCKYCNDTGSYTVIEQDREGEHYLEHVECGCEFMRRHAIEDTTGEEE